MPLTRPRQMLQTRKDSRRICSGSFKNSAAMTAGGSEEPEPRALEAEASPAVKPSSEEVPSKEAEPQAAEPQEGSHEKAREAQPQAMDTGPAKATDAS